MKKIAWKSISPMRLNDLKGGRLRLIPFLLVISAVLFVMSAACSKDDGGTSEPATVPVSSIKLTQTSVTLNVGESVELTATVSPSNATNRTVKWSSSNTNIATVTDGKVTAKAVGTATIKAQCGNVKAECSITVKAAGAISINLNPTSAELYEDETIQLTATVTPEDTSEPITWKSSNEEIAIVSEGKVYARKVGKADITASVGSGDNAKTATCSVTVKCHVEGVKLENHSLTVKQGSKSQLSATVYPERASNKAVSWSSDAPPIVSVSETGMLEAKSSGTAKITVTTAEGGFKDECVVTVISDVDGITLNINELDLRVKETYQLTATISPANATNKDVTWTSDNQTVATVDDNGKVTAVAPGKAVICATTKDGGLKAFCSVKVRSKVDEITLSEKEMTLYTTDASKRTLTSTVTPADADFTLIWKSDNEAVATVKASGKTTCEVIPVGRGNTTIRVSTADGFVSKNTVSVTVKQPYTEIKLNKSQLTLNKGVAEQLTATPSPQTPDDFIVWSSDRTDIATVDNNGNVTAVKAGTAIITAASKLRPNVVKATCTVTVTRSVIPVTGVSVSPTTLALNIGESEFIKAMIEPTNATNKDIIWASTNPTVAKVDEYGKVTAVAPGEAVICATTQDGGHHATCTVTVTSPVVHVTGVSVKPTELTMYKGESKTITATITPGNATNKNVSWRSSNASVATVNLDGTVVARSIGTTTVTVTTEDGEHEASCTVTVKDNPVNVTSITLDKSSFVLSFGDSETVNATIKPDNATNKKVIWTSSDPTVAKVEGGVVTAMSKEGTVIITATSEDNPSKSAICTVKVVRRIVPVTGLTVSPTPLNIYLGQKIQLKATVLPADATDKSVVWSVQQGSGSATVDQNGVVTALKVGTARVFVKTNDGGYSKTVQVTIENNDVKSIELPYDRITLKIGETYDLTATVTGKDASAPASNPNVTWKSSSATIATVASLEGTYVNKKTGRITAHKAGTTTITVTSQDNHSVKAACGVTVVSSVVPVTGVSISPTELTLYKGESKTITATITPSNAENKNVAWRSSNASVASVNANGTVVARSVGYTTITVETEDGSHTASCNVTVKEKPVNVTSITLDKSSFTLSFGDSETINATIAPANATNKEIIWTSSDPTVAKVEGGKVTAMSKEGTVTITAKSADNPSKYATCTVTVTRPVIPVTSIALNKTSATLSAGETVQLTATVSPNNATNKTVTWSSSNTSVATVSNGKVTAKAAGLATITARTNNGLSATCSITVVKDGDVPPGGSEETGEEEWK